MQDTTTMLIEMAPFRIKEGVSADDLATAARRIERDFLASQPGFLGRDLVTLENGRYADIVRWAGKEEMDAALAKIDSSPACAAYFAIMDYNPETDPMVVMRCVKL